MQIISEIETAERSANAREFKEFRILFSFSLFAYEVQTLVRDIEGRAREASRRDARCISVFVCGTVT